jgi:UDP-N-acetylmuramyl pentapeptide phosphotransferase/UDP-N-acetylglucosamine-1-phosphate transferase
LIPALVNTAVIPPLIALIVSGTVVALLVRSPVVALALDHPNPRSLHEKPTPRLGGVGIISGIAAAWCYAEPAIDPWLLAALALLIGVSVGDDIRGISVFWRLLIHLASAALAVTAALPGQEWWLAAVVALAVAWMINLYNFMDGADGLAGGMAAIGFGSYGIAALAGGDFSFATTNLSVAAAALGFLLFNFPPARIFMGDAGAIPLGCLAAVFNITGWQRGDWPWWFGIVIFSPFIVDASLTLAKRILCGAKIWEAHREHYYQRLVQSGWGHRKTVYAEYALMVACSLFAFAGARLQSMSQGVALGGVAFLYTGIVFVLEYKVCRSAHA